MSTIKNTLEDGRQWNGLAYVHNSPVAGCTCGSCAGYFPQQNAASIERLVAAMNANNAAWKRSPYRGYEITETRRKYHLLNSILSNGQRSAVFMIDRTTLEIRKADGYGKAGRRVGTVAGMIAHYEGINAKMRLGQTMGVIA